MNRTLKEILRKLVAETGGDWVALLPLCYAWMNSLPTGLTPPRLCMDYHPQLIPNLKQSAKRNR